VSLIDSENWDGVTAPAIPAGWTATSLATATVPWPVGVGPVSPPNMLGINAGGSTHYPASFNTNDGNGGNCVVTGYFTGQRSGGTLIYGVLARGSVYPVLMSSTFYWAQLNIVGGTLVLWSVSAGTPTSLATVNAGGNVAEKTMYQIQLTCQSTTISITVLRYTDSFTMNTGGAFVSGPPQIAISVTDSSVSGVGYAGLTLQASLGKAYADDWSFSTFGAPGANAPRPVITTVPVAYQLYPQWQQ
jgi:hypothetical protein